LPAAFTFTLTNPQPQCRIKPSPARASQVRGTDSRANPSAAGAQNTTWASSTTNDVGSFEKLNQQQRDASQRKGKQMQTGA